jgi:RES domain-containing protein
MDVETVAAGGEWIRHVPYRTDLWGRSAEATDGRWQHGGVVQALYLADTAQTAIAEWYRFLAERGLPPGQAIPHDHHIWQVDLEVADLSTPERLARVGLQPPRPDRATWTAFQDVGDQLFEAGYAGLLAPSAARPDARVKNHENSPVVIMVFPHL